MAPKNTVVEPVPIDLGDGVERGLLYDAPAVVRLEETARGRSVFALMVTEAGIAHMSLMIWGGLLWKNRELPLADVQLLVFDRMCNGGSIADLLSPVYEAFKRSGLLKRRDEENGEGEKPDPH